MCGIFGVVSKQFVASATFHGLGEINTQRGNLAFGGFIGYQTNSGQVTGKVFRFAQPFGAKLTPVTGAHLALGHIRAPTGGQSQKLAEVHPFANDEALLAHNGLLLNYNAFPQWRLNHAIDVDSQVILGGIQHYLQQGHAPANAVKKTVAQLEGQQACWLWHKPSNMLYLWRVMSPIYIQQQPNQFVFSSIKCEQADTLLPEGSVFKLNPFTLEFTEVLSFSFHSPYRT